MFFLSSEFSDELHPSYITTNIYISNILNAIYNINLGFYMATGGLRTSIWECLGIEPFDGMVVFLIKRESLEFQRWTKLSRW